jgi:hypothetical protein
MNERQMKEKERERERGTSKEKDERREFLSHQLLCTVYGLV